MNEDLYRAVRGTAVCGFVCKGGFIIKAAPMIGYIRGKPLGTALQRLRERRWKIEHLYQANSTEG